jgi:Putative beta-barrel porin 2
MAILSCVPVRTALAVALLGAFPGWAHAARIDYEVGVSVLHSDNIGLSATDEQSDTVVSPQLRFNVAQEGSTFRLNGSGQLQYLDYRDDTFDDGFRGAFAGSALWTMIPERLDWTFEDYLSRQPVDTLTAFSPGNEQQTNLFVTGPTLYFRLGQSTRGQVDLRYSNSYAEENETFNSDRYNVAARAVRELSTTRNIGLNLEATQVRYDDSPISDYTRYDGYARYWSQFRAVEVNLDLGYSRLEFDNRPNNDEWLPLARFGLAWDVAPRSRLDASLSYEFSDAAENLIVADLDAPPVLDDFGNPTVPITPDVFKQRRVEVGYTFTGERMGMELRPYYQRISYIDSLAPDEESYGGYATLSYQMRPRMTLSLLAAHEERKFEDPSRRDRDFTASLALDNQFTRHWSARFELQRRERNSSLAGQDYDENAAIVSFSYRR